MDVEPKIVVPKMDGENNRKPYEQMDDLGLGVPLFFGNTQIKLVSLLTWLSCDA